MTAADSTAVTVHGPPANWYDDDADRTPISVRYVAMMQDGQDEELIYRGARRAGVSSDWRQQDGEQ
jgi:hypothetical protein